MDFKYALCLISFILGIKNIFAKTIEDPVARHDAQQCGIYLCRSLPVLAKEYIQSGCIGSFYEHIKSNIPDMKENLNLVSKNIQENSQYSGDIVNGKKLIYFSIFSLITSLIGGYILGLYDKKLIMKKYISQNKNF